MLSTGITDTLGLKAPVIQGGMAFAATPRLVSAVANAGGLGILPCVNYRTADKLQQAIEETASLTDGVWGVNIGTAWKPETLSMCIDAVSRNRIPVVETNGPRPESMKVLTEKGVFCYHKIPAVKFAGKLKDCGYAAVATVGYQAGGHPGAFGTTSEIICQKAVDSIGLPIIMGGGVYDGRGLTAALAYGASAVLMGTRFLASTEAEIGEGIKEWIVNSTVSDTLLLGSTNPNRVAHTECAVRLKQMETEGGDAGELLRIMAERKDPAGWSAEKFEEYLLSMGLVCGLIESIESCTDIIEGMVQEAEQLIGVLNEMCSKK